MQNSVDENGMAIVNVAITITLTTGVLMRTIANTVVFYIAMVSHHAHRAEVMVLYHTRAKDSGGRPDLYAKLKDKFIDAKLLEIKHATLR